MKAVYLIKNGSSKAAFEIRETKIPTPGKGEVVIKVEAFGLNYADVMARRGLYKAAPPKPSILGYDVAGTVYSIGPDTPGFLVGQRVAAMTRFGGYAEYAGTKGSAVIPISDSIDYSTATALATQASTAVYSACFATRLYSGDHVLVHAAAGGVGTILVQIAKAKGCVIFGSAALNKHSYLKELGVDFPIDSNPDQLEQELGHALKGKKLDVVFDNIGGLSFKKGYQLLGPGGRIVAFGAAAQNLGKRSNQLNTMRVGLGFGFHSPIGLIIKSQTMAGVNMLAIADKKPAVLAEVMAEVGHMLEQGIICPILGKSFPAEQIAEAHEFLESRLSTGKIALTW
jgi:NADPH:quinone reductase-like Zn-dependent oxidoreductase